MWIQRNRAFRLLRSTCFVLLAALVLLGAASRLTAQGITGTITGTVADQSGSVIPGATVTVHQVETNAERVLISSDAGTYKATLLPPGHYLVKAAKNGFRSFSQSGIVLAIDQTLMVDAKLEIGANTETVEVTTAPPVIQTEESSIGQVIDSQAIQNTPLNGRLSVMGLIALSPGVQGVGAQDQLATRGLTLAAGTGSRNSYGGLGNTLDGVANQEVTLQRAEPEIPSLDALSQFKVISTGAPAEFGQPTQVIVVSASGANQFHGELLWYNRSKGTAAKQYFGANKPRPSYERNEFGGNFAGPVVLPHLYNGKDRTFFFFAYEGFRLNQSSSTTTTQPTAAMRSGNFAGFTAITNPATGSAFTNNQITSINAVSQSLMNKLMPCTAASTFTSGNCQELVPYNSSSTRISLHMDHRLGPNDQVRGTWLMAHYGPNPTVGTDSLQGGRSGDGEKNTNIILGWTHTFSPTMLLDTTGSFFHLPIFRSPQNVNTQWESIIPGLAPQSIEGAPHLSFTNGVTGTGESGSHDLEQTGQINSSLTKIYAKHTIKIGFGYLYDNHFNVSAISPEHGKFTFNGQYSGNAFADFLLGLPSTSAQGNPSSFTTRNISSQWYGYIQDDWKPMSKLTINMGVRYDLQWFSPGPYNNAALWVPSLKKVVVFGDSYPSSIVPSSQALLNQYGLLTLSSNANLSSNVFSYLGRPAKNIAPRLGFAYAVLPNTVLRGAAGIYFNLLPPTYVGAMWGSAPFVDYSTYTNTNSYNASTTFTMSNAFAGSASGHGSSPSVSAEAQLKTPYTEEYNLALEHQFKYGIAARVGYVGQHNVKQNNSPDTGYNSGITPDLNLPEPQNPSIATNSQRPVSALGSIAYNMDPLFHTTMNSLQAGVHKQFASGLAFGAEYQWVRVLGTESFQDPTGAYPSDSYGPVGGMTPQVLQFNYSYSLPFGRGHALFSNVGNVANSVLSGWQFSGSTNIQSGQPFSVTFDAGVSPTTGASSKGLPGAVSGRANRVAGVSLYPSTKTKSQWFNPAAFTCPTVTDSSDGKSYCSGYGNSGYNMLRGPRFQNWDMSLQKNTTWMGRYKVQLRADTFNVFNHPNFGTPNADITTGGVGTVTSTSGTPSYEARTIEFAIKFNF